MDSNGIENSCGMGKKLKMMEKLRRYGELAGEAKINMTESSYYKKISTYLDENKRKTALEAEIQNMVVEAIDKKEKRNSKS